MSTGYFNKQPASRPVVYQNLTLAGPPVLMCTAKFSNGTQQIRVLSSIPGWMSIDQTTSATGITSASVVTTAPGGLFLPAATFTGEYFAVTPGQLLTFCSTGTSSGNLSVTEMA